MPTTTSPLPSTSASTCLSPDVTALFRTSFAALIIALFNPAARAGVRPLRPGTGLVLIEDVARYRVLPDRVEVRESLRLENQGKAGTFLLGLPAGDVLRAPQDLEARLGKSTRRLKIKRHKGGPGQSAWLAFRVRIAAGMTADLEVTWWQSHAAVEHYGYPRLAVVDQLWTPAGRIERRASFAPGVAYVYSSPEAAGSGGEDWERQDRTWVAENNAANQEGKFSLLYRLTGGASSPCSGAGPYRALDGKADTVWKPSSCPPGGSNLEIPTGCRGIGTPDPRCNQPLSRSLVLGLRVRSPDKNERAAVTVEGWWGPRRVWSKRGRVNRPVTVHKNNPVTRLRVVFPGDLPASGIAEVNLVRLDLEHSPKGADALFASRGRPPRVADDCQFRLVFTNPFSLDHITLRLPSRIPPRDWIVNAGCAGDRGEEMYAEPVPHHKHSRKDLPKMANIDPDVHHHDAGHGHPGKGFKRKHPDRIELDTDPACMVNKLRLETILLYCTGGRRTPRVPRIRLVY